MVIALDVVEMVLADVDVVDVVGRCLLTQLRYGRLS